MAGRVIARAPRRVPVPPAVVLVMVAWATALLAGWLPGHPALAQEVPRLAGPVTDEAGALSAGEAEALVQALEGRRSAGGAQLLALYVGTTGGRTVTDFADAVAEANSLGGDDALLVVALEDRTYALWAGDALGVSDAEIDGLLTGDVEPLLADGDFAGAAVAAAEALDEAAAGEAAGDGIGVLPVLAILAGVLLLGGVAWRRIRVRRGLRREAEERDRRARALAREANALLLASDEAVREADQELGFAEAQFRDQDVRPFRDALGQAREELRAAFALRQRLDDGDPETPEEREALLHQIIEHAKRIDGLLDAERARLAELRDLERNAPALLAALPGQRDAAERRAGQAEPLLERVRTLASRSAAAVHGNLVEARKRLAAVADAVGRGEAARDAGDRAATARAVRDGQEALAGAVGLVEAVERLAAAAESAERELEADLRTAEGEVAGAKEAVDTGVTQDYGARLAEARSLLERARAEAAAGDRDVLEARRLATEAAAAAGEVLAGVREAAEQRARERAAAEAALRSAEAACTRASDYLATRRRGIGPEARTRLEEAERRLERGRAELGHDDREAAAEARAAERLADEAFRRARRDFEDYDRYRGPFGRGPFGGGWGRGGTVIIGGFPVPIGGSSRGGGGWGGSGWGSRGRARGGGFGGFGGGARGGGFGGGARGGRF